MKNKNYNKKARTADWIFGLVAVAAAVVFIPILYLFLGIGFAAAGVFGGFVRMVTYGIILGGLWLFLGIKAAARAERSKKYTKIFGPYPYPYPRMKMSEVVKAMGKPLESVSAELSVMKKCGYFDDMSFDLDNKEVVFSPDSEPLPTIGADSMTVYKENRRLPYLATISAGITGASFLWNWELASWVLAVVAGVGAFFLVRRFFPASYYFTVVKRKSPKLKKPSATGNNDHDSTLAAIFESKTELLRLSTTIKSPRIGQPLGEILRSLDQISAYVSEKSVKPKSLRQFTNYYLPTTVNFLQTYEELESKPVQGENIGEALRKIEDVTLKIADVFKREYDDLFSDRVMALSAEAAVMQAIIKEL